jgi:hypothetical protein
MANQFIHLQSCRWHDCGRRFDGHSPCGSYSNHITDYLKQMQTPQYLWNGCFQTFRSVGSLAHHVSAEHCVPNDWTMLTEMHYCYKHNAWCKSKEQWEQYIRIQHLPNLGDYCGMIQLQGVVVVAAHCLFCLGNTGLPLTGRFHQFPNPYTLNKHMQTKHQVELAGISSCPHPRCKDKLSTASAFWYRVGTRANRNA